MQLLLLLHLHIYSIDPSLDDEGQWCLINVLKVNGTFHEIICFYLTSTLCEKYFESLSHITVLLPHI